MDKSDPYLRGLKNDFDAYSIELKKLKKILLKKSSTPEAQARIVKRIDSIAGKMESNQRQAVKVTKSRIKERKAKSKR